MNIGIIGVGQAGGKITDCLLGYAKRTRTDFVADAIVVNSARADLLGLANVPMKKRILVGQARVKGNGAGANNELGATIAREDSEEVLAEVAKFPVESVDAFLVVAGLGGGTGSGGAPVYAGKLQERFREPIYGLGVLPARAEGGIYQLNAARSFKTFLREVDNLLVLDNDAFQLPDGGSLQASFAHVNRELARRLGVLLTASEGYGSATPELVVDASEIINTLSTGGITSIGYATAELDREPGGMLDWFLDRQHIDDLDQEATASQIVASVRRATLGQLTLPCTVSSTDRALLVVAGPPEYLSRQGLQDAVTWLEARTDTREVRGGDCPLPDEDRIAALVVLSGVREVPRLDDLYRVAVDVQARLSEIRDSHPQLTGETLWAYEEELEPLY